MHIYNNESRDLDSKTEVAKQSFPVNEFWKLWTSGAIRENSMQQFDVGIQVA